MKTTTNYTLMLRGGSSVLFGKKELSELLTQIEPISLREFLLLGDDLPDDPPPEREDGILVSGLETVLDAMPIGEAEEFLAGRLRGVIQQIQNHWTRTGIVFGCSLSEKAFREKQGVSESVVFTTISIDPGEGIECVANDENKTPALYYTIYGTPCSNAGVGNIRLVRDPDGTFRKIIRK